MDGCAEEAQPSKIINLKDRSGRILQVRTRDPVLVTRQRPMGHGLIGHLPSLYYSFALQLTSSVKDAMRLPLLSDRATGQIQRSRRDLSLV